MTNIDLNDFKVRACIDWIQLRCRFARNSEGGKLRTRLLSRFGVSHALPQGAAAGNAASVFDLTVQAPESFEQLLDLRSFLDSEYGLVSELEIMGIEVANDWQHKFNDELQLDAQTRYLMHSIMPPVSNNPRMSKGRRDHDFYLLPHRRGIETDKSLYIGNDIDDLLWRLYFKRTDDSFLSANNTRLAKPLDQSEYRARAEVRIRGAALKELGLVTLADMQHFKFERLQRLHLFRFGMYRESDQPMYSNRYAAAAMAAHHVDQQAPACVLNAYGQRDSRKRPLAISRHVVVNEPLTESGRSALRSLSNRFTQSVKRQNQKSGGESALESPGLPIAALPTGTTTLITICTALS